MKSITLSILWFVVLSYFMIACSNTTNTSNTIQVTNNQYFGDLYIEKASIILSELDEKLISEELEKDLALGEMYIQRGDYGKAIEIYQDISEKGNSAGAYNNVGVLYSLIEETEKAREAFEESLLIDAENPQAHYNFAMLEESVGNYKAAEYHLSQSSDPKGVELQKEIHHKTTQGNLELEPNNSLEGANPIELGKSILGKVAADDINDFYSFHTPPTYRDIVEISFQSGTQFSPAFTVFDAEKARVSSSFVGTRGQSFAQKFSVEPDKTYYLQIKSYHRVNDANGNYEMTTQLLNAFDEYEPNESILTPAKISWSQKIQANILDGKDLDAYQLPIVQTTDTCLLEILLDNLDLLPYIEVFDQDRQRIHYARGRNRGQNLRTKFLVKEGNAYYLTVKDYSGNASGNYEMTLTGIN